jgi:hypothetical protein
MSPRPLTEAERHARRHGDRDGNVSVLRRGPEPDRSGVVRSRVRELVDRRLAESNDETSKEAA